MRRLTSFFRWSIPLKVSWIFWVVVGLAVLLSNLRSTSQHKVSQTLKARESLYGKEDLLLKTMDSALHVVLSRQSRASLIQTDPSMAYFVYVDDSLAQWSSAEIPVPFRRFDEEFLQPIMQLRNGWYRILLKDSGQVSVVGMIQLKQEFFIKNEFLKDAFAPCLDFD